MSKGVKNGSKSLPNANLTKEQAMYLEKLSRLDDGQIVTIKHGWKNPSYDSDVYTSQCEDLAERLVFDVTSRNPRRSFARQVSPMYMGPVITGDGMDAKCFEVYWQASKVYPCHAFMGEPTEGYWKYRKELFSKGVDEIPNMEKRYPNRMLGYQTKDCVTSIWYNKETQKYECLGYVGARKKEYIPEYAKLVVGTQAYKELEECYKSGKKMALIDFDVYNYYKEGKTIFDVINENRPAGHGYVIKMLLEGALEVIDGELIDHIGILNPVSQSELNVKEIERSSNSIGNEKSTAEHNIVSYNTSDRSHKSPFWGQTISNDRYVYFYQGVSLSNWSTSKRGIPLDGHVFSSSESIFMYFKALYFKDYEMAEKIANAGYFTAKRLGAMVKNFDQTEWFKVSFRAMYKALELKYMHDEDFRTMLMDERYWGKEFVEASKSDSIWGIGTYVSESVLDSGSSEWRGLNRLGKTLTILRDNMLGDGSQTELTLVNPDRLNGDARELYQYETACIESLKARIVNRGKRESV